MSKFPTLLFNQTEQLFIYIGGYGLSDVIIKKMRLNTNQKIIYYIFFLLLGLLMVYYSNDL